MVPANLIGTVKDTCARKFSDVGLTSKQRERIDEHYLNEKDLNDKEAAARPRKDRNASILNYNLYRVQSRVGEPRITGFVMNHFSKKSLEELEPIAIKDMMVPKVHVGRYLLCRTIVPSFITYGVHLLIEDPAGDVEKLDCFNIQSDLRDDPNKSIPVGTIMIIKEPYLKLRSSCEVMTFREFISKPDGLYFDHAVRCDSPSDIVFLETYDERLAKLAPNWFVKISTGETFHKLKEKGNQMYGWKRYEESVKYYNRALQIEPENEILFLNKAAAYLQLNRFWDAYAEAKAAYEKATDNSKVKALFRMGKAAYGMRDWKLAFEHYSTLLDRHPDYKFAQDELKKTKARIEESQTGVYDLTFLKNESEKGVRSLDVADYVGPVKVVDIEGKGKGLITTKAVKKGALLLASKAFFSSTDYDYPFHVISVEYIDSLAYFLDSIAIFRLKIIELFKNNPYRLEELYSLHAGNIGRNEVLPFGVIDPGRIVNIVRYNAFGDISSSGSIYILPSFINHSCLPNSQKVELGDLVMIKACKRLRKGEEVTISYWEKGLPKERRLELAFKFGFRCQCPLCK